MCVVEGTQRRARARCWTADDMINAYSNDKNACGYLRIYVKVYEDDLPSESVGKLLEHVNEGIDNPKWVVAVGL